MDDNRVAVGNLTFLSEMISANEHSTRALTCVAANKSEEYKPVFLRKLNKAYPDFDERKEQQRRNDDQPVSRF